MLKARSKVSIGFKKQLSISPDMRDRGKKIKTHAARQTANNSQFETYREASSQLTPDCMSLSFVSPPTPEKFSPPNEQDLFYSTP